MKKYCYLIMVLLFSIVMISCDKEEEEITENLVDDNEEIVLGEEVDSVTIKLDDENEITFTKESDFYDVLDLVYLNYNNKKISFYYEDQMGDEAKTISQGSLYLADNYSYFICDVNFEGSSDVASIKEYSYRQNTIVNNQNYMFYNFYSSYSYLNEKAFGGQEIDTKNNINTTYRSSVYPMMPPVATEGSDEMLGKMQIRGSRIKTIIYSEVPAVYKYSSEYSVNGKVYDLASYVTESFKLYNNYIVFEQTSPFAFDMRKMFGHDSLKYALIEKSISSCSVKHTVIYDINKKEVVSYSLLGDALSLQINSGIIMSINLTMKYSEINESELNKSVNELKDYIYANCDARN